MEGSDLFSSMIPMAIILALFIVPIWVMLGRTGKSRLWVLLTFVPFGAFIVLWVLAFSRWPAADPLDARLGPST